MGKLFILFAVMPIVEIAVLIHVGEIIGGWNTVAIVLFTAFVGAYLVKREGISTLTTAQRKMQQGKVPGEEMAQGLLLVIAGVLLVTPGFVTDFIGLLFTLPPTRKFFAKSLMAKMVASPNVSASFTTGQFNQHGFKQGTAQSSDADGDIIEGEYHATDNERLNTPQDDNHNSDNQRRR
ncbi:FxsA family protein [Alteromonas oceanisediminis]|uniref:FxsA family protein n=1 Tax=Alteromonas oceanisediminis TaxID=2836180 RepID=UPI001BDA0312|nr:FxsA family protein [Alteromonas oceanisediminis]MBT0586255.1 FxsA family protein [Alteromonas oceanisediminis]